MTSVDDLLAQTSAAHASTEEASAPATAVGDKVNEALTQTGAAKTTAEELAGALAGLGMGTKAEQTQAVGEHLEGLANRLHGVQDGAAALVAELLAIRTEFASALRAIQASKEALERAPRASGSRSVPPGSNPPPAPPLVRRLAERLPVWDEDEPTRAWAYTDEDGAAIEFRSGRDRTSRTGLKPEFANRWVMDHAEAKLAASVRESVKDRHVTMVINKEPCQGPKGCDQTLPAIIPAGSSITIYLRDERGVAFYRHYQGTGEGIDHDS